MPSRERQKLFPEAKMIHPTAVIHPKAQIGPGVKMGPYCVIDEHVRLGAECELGPHVYLTGQTEIGSGNKIHAGAVIGDLPQDLRFKGELTGVRMGDNNVIREHVTIHRSNNPAEPTRLGSNNLLMANAHVGHNAVIGDHVIIANGTMLGGHAEIGDRAFLSANCLIHQFTRVGTLCLMQGMAGVSLDLPPYTTAMLHNQVCGLNVIGLRRAGFTSAERLELKRLYHRVLRGTERFRDIIGDLEREFTSDKAKVLLEFLKTSKRGFCRDQQRARMAGREEELEN
jgi:UDP-N-acetylglucosamine acyltransferase